MTSAMVSYHTPIESSTSDIKIYFGTTTTSADTVMDPPSDLKIFLKNMK